jgi:hypothetical protein
MSRGRQAALTGKAGEYIVAGQLMLRDVNVFWPSFDEGCDFMTGNGCRVQVKTAHLYGHPNGPRYSFPLLRMRRIAKTNNVSKLMPRKAFSEVCDVVVFYGVEQNRFWIVPSALCDQVTGVELGYEPKLRRFQGSVTDMREMLSLGFSKYKVAKHYGIAQTSLQQFLDSGQSTIDETVVSQIRTCEGRWDHIIDFVKSAAVSESAQIREE